MRLLLAEDEKSLSRALCAILAKNNYSVEAVYDGQDALDYLLSGEYDCAVLDVMMPKMDGFTVLRKIREKGITIPVMMLTARSEIDDKVEGLDLGANDYLTKPFESRELLARLRAITRSVATAADNSLRFGNIVLDRKSFELSGPSGSVRLAAKEYQMMEYLMSNPGALISTDRFMEKVWGLDSDADINVVWTNLSYLRKKLTSVGSDVKIKAARNAGYFLEVEK
ncbi:MAG: response regulator transcription factor [Clostridiales bacterium]|nr:response regulator transcription factor [Clostridiales bacterium]MBR3031946.1 response regulator transcription factor [Clostridiales bacterium]MBR4009596.1 response regulator transcription factor [Clostridiales bacterium]MBR6254989.1 response regulator transcription factor [Clostridiales bacterium]